MVRSRVWCSWNIQPRRNLNDWAIEEMGRLLALLEKCHMGDMDLHDERIWLLNKGKRFFVKSMYEALRVSAPISCPNKFVWNPQIPSKVSFFMWEPWWDQAPLINTLITRGLVITNWCCMCTSDGESSKSFGPPLIEG